MISAQTYRFLSDLKKNNSRDWFLAHKAAYEQAKAEVEGLVADLIGRIGAAKDFHDRAGYYVHLEPGASMLGGGAYMPSPLWLKAIRQAIDRDGGSLKAIVGAASFKKYFGTLQGEALKRNVPGFRPDHLYMDFLKRKSFLAVHPLKDKDVQAPGFPKHAGSVFKAMKPLNAFLNEALEDA